MHPTAVIQLNKAIAYAYAVDKSVALLKMLEIEGLENYYIYPTAIGELYYEIGNMQKAREYYSKALRLTSSHQEQLLLKSKIQNCTE